MTYASASLVLDISILLAVVALLHHTSIYKTPFVLYVCLVIKWFFFVVTDVDRFFDFGTFTEGYTLHGNDWLVIVMPKLILLFGLTYTNYRTRIHYEEWKRSIVGRFFSHTCKHGGH